MRSTPAVTTRERAWRIAAMAADLVAQLHDRAAVDEAGDVGVGDGPSSCTRDERATR